MKDATPELTPREVGTHIPVSPQIPPETYTYDYIVVGGKLFMYSISFAHGPFQVARQDAFSHPASLKTLTFPY